MTKEDFMKIYDQMWKEVFHTKKTPLESKFEHIVKREQAFINYMLNLQLKHWSKFEPFNAGVLSNMYIVFVAGWEASQQYMNENGLELKIKEIA